VVTILPVDKITVRFAVPLGVATHLQNGRNVTLICDRCGTPVRATVTHVSPFAQQESQTDSIDSLRYMVEARPDPAQAALLKPGQPVTVVL
jgi:HlyD family secretion protein